MKLPFLYGADLIEIEAATLDGSWTVTLPSGSTFELDVSPGAEDAEFTIKDGANLRLYALPAARTERGIEISCKGITYLFTVPRPSAAAVAGKPAASGLVVAPMVGVVAELHVAEGDIVAAYQPLAVVESMKVMAAVEAPFDGTVRRVLIEKGSRLTHNQPMFEVGRAED